MFPGLDHLRDVALVREPRDLLGALGRPVGPPEVLGTGPEITRRKVEMAVPHRVGIAEGRDVAGQQRRQRTRRTVGDVEVVAGGAGLEDEAAVDSGTE